MGRAALDALECNGALLVLRADASLRCAWSREPAGHGCFLTCRYKSNGELNNVARLHKVCCQHS
jgi:hypothetical protein